ncbi:MAG TPA: hypothetical protein PLK12_14170 [Prolixibacteraceae bacterium]|nr:hypothetical protein [Prolixibacteraceae bacterium]
MKKKEQLDLKKLRNRNPFLVPEGYFDSFPGLILERIEQEKPRDEKTTVIRLLRPALWLAASFLIIFSSVALALRYANRIHSGSPVSQTVSLQQETEILHSFTDRYLFELIETANDPDELSAEDLKEILLASVSDYDLMN